MAATDTHIVSARPKMTAEIMAKTGLDEEILSGLVRRFYGRVRADAVLGPIFADRISDWDPHLERMVAFWSSVALLTGRYRGAPVPAVEVRRSRDQGRVRWATGGVPLPEREALS